jgi:hypothetical protein
MRGRSLVELSHEAWDKAKATIVRGGFLDADATREELSSYRYLLYKEKKGNKEAETRTPCKEGKSRCM